MEVDDLALRNPIHIGYYDPFSIYPLVKESLQANLPLANLNWKYHTSKPLKSIPTLPLKFVEEVPKASKRLSAGHEDVYNKLSYSEHNVYLRLMFVKYDSLDTYRSQVRPLIKEWLRNLVANSKLEWMIIFYVPGNSKDKHSTMIKTSSFDKLKIDFNNDGKEIHSLHESSLLARLQEIERCFKLKAADKTQFTDFIALIKKLLLSSFSSNFVAFTAENSATQSANPLDRFMKKLTLADLLNDMRLSQDSLTIYDELYRELDKLYLSDPNNFNIQNAFKTKDYTNFNLESEEEITQFKLSIFENKKINLIELKSLIFIKQSYLLQSLANYANAPISIVAIHLSTLYQKLCYFLNDITSSVDDWLGELIIVTIDKYLELPIYHKLVEANNHNNENRGDAQPYQLNEIQEFRAELTLLKRSKIVEIAESKGYYINGFREILDDIPLDGSVTKKDWTFKYDPLIKVFNSEDSYFTEYEALTVTTIQDFIHCNRPKTIDVLSIEIAILNYHKGKYQEALNVLQDTYDFFIINGWSFMGAVLLEIYMDCIERLQPEDHELILITCLKLFASLHLDIVSENNFGINNYRLIKQNKFLVDLFSKIQQQALQLDELIAFPIESIFHTKISPYIMADDSEFDTYFIELELTNVFEIAFDLESISIELFSSLTGEKIRFSAAKIHINEAKEHRIKLFTNHFILGKFSPSKLELYVNPSLRLMKVYSAEYPGDEEEKELDADTTVIKYSATAIESSPNRAFYTETGREIYFYQNLNKLWCEFSNAPEVDLGVTEMILRIHNGSLAISSVAIYISTGTEGLKMTCGPFEVNDIEDILDIRVPYSYYSDNKHVNMRAFITYESGGQSFSHSISEFVDSSLKISISVQDIFRGEYLYSKFQVGTSNPRSPIKVVGNKLSTAKDNYEIVPPQTKLQELIAFGDQPASIFYKIIPMAGYTISDSDTLDLAVDYTNLNDECEEYASDYFILQLRELKLVHYWFLIRSLIFPHFKFDLTNFAYNFEVTLTNMLEVLQIAETVLLQCVEHRSEQLAIKKLFKDIPINDKLKVKTHQLRISVPIPILKFLHLVEFHYENKLQYMVGEPIDIELTVETVTKWAPEKLLKEDFQLQIQNDDNWLLSGFKRHTFCSSSTNLKLVLIPLNVGKVLLPKVSIRPVNLALADSSMDVHVKNGSETVLVVPAVDRITFSF